MDSHYEKESKFGWVTATIVIVFVVTLQAYLASKLSFWADEISAIAPAFSPWHGEKNFWWQIRQYVANPPGENLVLRLLYKCGSLRWLLESSPELFWRLPYILVYAASAIATYFYAEKWSRSTLVGSFILCLFISAPGPFNWATETRFYSWAIFFMTLATWEGLFFIKSNFSQKNFIRVSAVTTLGLLFHISLVLIAYLLLIYSVSIILNKILEWKKRSHFRVGIEAFKLLKDISPGVIPYLFYIFECRYVLWIPDGSKWKVLGKTILEVPETLTKQVSLLLPFGTTGGWIILSILLVALLGLCTRTLFIRDRVVSHSAIFLLSLGFGGPFLMLLSTNANHFAVMGRYFLFSIPVLFAAVAYVVSYSTRIRSSLLKTPFLIKCAFSIGVLAFGLMHSFEMARSNIEGGSPAKINYDFVSFRNFYEKLPDRGKLVLVGVGVGEQLLTTDSGDWIGGLHSWYLEKFSPIYLNSKTLLSGEYVSHGRTNESRDYVIFSPVGHEPKVPGMDWSKLRCHSFSWNKYRFCR